MGPNKQVKGKKTIGAPAKPKKTKDKDASLIDRLDELLDDCNGRGKKRLRRRNTDEAAAKKLRDNFPGWTQEQTHLHLVDGKSLWDSLKEDMKKENEESVTMGKHYYDLLRNKFMAADAPMRQLVANDPTDEVDPSLLEALTCMMKHKKSFTEILNWRETVVTVNQKNFVALCRQVLKLNPNLNMDFCHMIIGVMKLVVRLELIKQFGAEAGHVKTQFDKACLRSIDGFKRNDLSSQTWWLANKDWASLVLPMKETDKCMAERKDWGEVEEELAKVCSSSESGRRLFGLALEQLDMAKVRAKVRAAVDQLGGKDLTTLNLLANRSDFMAKMVNLGIDPAKSCPKRVANIAYRGVPCEVEVLSILEEYNLQVEAFVRTVAVDKGLLEALWSENDLVGPRPVPTIKVDPDVFSHSQLARRSLMDALENSDATADNIKVTLTKKFVFLQQADRHFKVEHAFWVGCMGSAGQRCLYDRILACMPTDKLVITLGKSDVLFKQLADSKLLQFCGSSMQSIFSSIHGFVTSMLQGRTPNLSAVTDSEFIVEVKVRMAKFCVCEMPASSSEESQILVGAAALAEQWKVVKTKFDSKDDLSLLDLKPLHIFAWMLQDEQKNELKKMTSQVLAQHGRMSQQTDAAKATKKASGPKKGTDNAKAMAAALFAK